jgi:hypothetical protein
MLDGVRAGFADGKLDQFERIHGVLAHEVANLGARIVDIARMAIPAPLNQKGLLCHLNAVDHKVLTLVGSVFLNYIHNKTHFINFGCKHKYKTEIIYEK